MSIAAACGVWAFLMLVLYPIRNRILGEPDAHWVDIAAPVIFAGTAGIFATANWGSWSQVAFFGTTACIWLVAGFFGGRSWFGKISSVRSHYERTWRREYDPREFMPALEWPAATRLAQLLASARTRIDEAEQGDFISDLNELVSLCADISSAYAKAIADSKEMREQLESANRPYFATAEIRRRLTEQAARASDLHQDANRRTKLFQFFGLAVIVVGLGIVATGFLVVVLRGQELKELALLAPVVSVIFNLVGSGLILFHRTAAKIAMDYFDRKQVLENLQIALEMLTNPILDSARDEVLPDFVRSLYSSSASSAGST